MRPAPFIGVAAALALGVTLAGCGSGDGSLAGKTPDQIVSSAIAAAEAQTGVHYQLQATGGTQTQSISGDAGRTSGEQHVQTGANTVDVILVGNMAYVRGNAGGLLNTIGLPKAVADSYAGKWISVTPSDTLFQPISQAVTLTGIFGQLKPSAPLQSSAPSTLAGQTVVGVKGGLPGQVAQGVSGSAILYVSTASPGLPIGFAGSASNSSQHVTDVGAFRNWGESLHLQAPPATVPFSSLPKS